MSILQKLRSNSFWRYDGLQTELFPAEKNPLIGAAWQEKKYTPEPLDAFQRALFHVPTKGEQNLTIMIMAVAVIAFFVLQGIFS